MLPFDLEFLSSNILYVVIIFQWIIFLWESYLEVRQIKLAKQTETVPSDLAKVIDEESFRKARSYYLDRITFSAYHSYYSQVETTLILLFGVLPLLWDFSGTVIKHFGFTLEYEITQLLVFVVLSMLLSQIDDTPWSLYSSFVIEEKHGFNKQTLRIYIVDTLKKFGILLAIIIPVFSALIYIIKIGGKNAFLYAWIFMIIVSLISMSIYPYIAALIDKIVPLPEGELRNMINDLASKHKFPLEKIMVVQGSRVSAHSNAYFFGLFNKRIMLYDTLLEDSSFLEPEKSSDQANEQSENENFRKGCTNEEVLAVLCHELGHWKCGHTIKFFIIMQVNMLFMLMVASSLMENVALYASFGFSTQPVIIGLIITKFILHPYYNLLSFVSNIISRSFEFEADRFAKRENRAEKLKSSLITLNLDNKGFPVTDWMYSAWHYSHPPLIERLTALDKTE